MSIINSFFDSLLKEPTYLSVFIVIFSALLVYLGWVVNANVWRRSNASTHANAFIGVLFVSEYVIFPIAILYWLSQVLPQKIVTAFDTWLLSIDVWIGFVLLIAYYLLLAKVDKKVYNSLKKDSDHTFSVLIVRIFNLGDLKFIFYLVNYWLIASVEAFFPLFFILWVDFIVLSKWARITNLYRQGETAEVKIRGKLIKEYRVIELVNNGSMITLHDKTKNEVMVVPLESVEYIKLNELPINILSASSKVVVVILRRLKLTPK